jgi:hypothetical protein
MTAFSIKRSHSRQGGSPVLSASISIMSYIEIFIATA